MVRSLTRSLIVFAAIFAAYQAYALVAVPWIEPKLTMRPGGRPTPQDRQQGIQSLTKYQRLLANYFPADHWSQRQPPKVIASSNEQAMLVMDDYERVVAPRADSPTSAAEQATPVATQVTIERFALLVFPTLPREGLTPPPDAIILEASQGATLQFDDFRPERGQIGQITRGLFPGRITIRSGMEDPGPNDDLLVETADLEMNTRLLYTSRPVRFRLGSNMGGGHELELRFLPNEHLQPKDKGFKIAGIESLEIRREVRLRLQLETESLLPGVGKSAGSRPRNGDAARGAGDPDPSLTTSTTAESASLAARGNANVARPGDAKPPVEIMCNGPFRFDFLRYTASVDRDVVLRQLNPTGPSDQVTCNQLDIHFAPRAVVGGSAEPAIVDPVRRQHRELGRLEPFAIVAAGHPVVVTSPARRAEARGDEIQIGLRDRRVAISGGNEVLLIYGPNVLRAPAIQYRHPADDEATTIGHFKATGPGLLQYVLDPDKPDQILQATWQQSAELGRDRGQPTLTLEGRPQLGLAELGGLAADKFVVYFRELNPQRTTGSARTAGAEGRSDDDRDLQIVPDRLAASGQVELQSHRFVGRVGQLVTTFRRQSAPPAEATTSASTENKSAAHNLVNQLQRGPGAAATAKSFRLDADQMHIEVLLRGQSAVPSSVVCTGSVRLRETTPGDTGEQPLEIRGGQLTVDRLDGDSAHVMLAGAGPNTPAGAALAQLVGPGVTVSAESVEVDQRANRLWSNGPGQAVLLMTRDLNGQASTEPVPMEVRWQGGMTFDGRTIALRRNVVVTGANYAMQCDEASARLSAPVQFDGALDTQAMTLAEAECRGNVTVDHRARDEVGIRSHDRLQLSRLAFNQQTGQLHGDGPGALRSTRFGGGLTSLGAPASGVAASALVAPPPGYSGSKLHYLRIDFQRGISGNVQLRELSFLGRVRTVYGPVDAWEQELDTAPSGSLSPESARLLCDELRANEDPLAKRPATPAAAGQDQPFGYVQLQALGNVRLEGQSSQHGTFGAQATRAVFEEAKDLFVLEGDPRSPATVWYAGQQGPPPQVRRISYSLKTGEMKVDGLFSLEISSEDFENARRPGTKQQ